MLKAWDVLDELREAAARKWQGDPAAQRAWLFARAADEVDELRRKLAGRDDMKELLGHASNLILAPDLDAPPKVKARIELVLICSEPVYGYGLEGLTRDREVSTMRVLAVHKALRETARRLIELADEAEALEKSMNAATAAAADLAA